MKSQSEIRQSVTTRIVEALKSGAVPFWRKPWSDGNQSGFPTNAATGRRYRGINLLLLSLAGHDSKWWATYNQWKSVGGQVRRGEKGSTIILYKPVRKAEINDDGDEEITSFSFLTTFTVFHISQVDGDLKKYRDVPQTESEMTFEDFPPAEEIFSATGADIRFGGDRAFYSPSEDYIQMPQKEAFAKSHEFYNVLAHEITHWTGNEKRLNRLDRFARFGNEAYALEELVAELGSAFLSAELGVPQSDDLSNVTAYLGSWLKVLERDPTAIFSASSAASAAVDYVLSFSREKEEVEEVGAVAVN